MFAGSLEGLKLKSRGGWATWEHCLGEDLVDADITGGCRVCVVEQFYSSIKLSHEVTQL